MTTITHQTLVYQADGLEMRGDLYRGDGSEARPGILVFPEATGIGEHSRSRARRLAEMGYVALACDLHGEAANYADMQQIMGLVGSLRQDPIRIRARAQGGLDALIAQTGVYQSHLAAIGYCFGGTMALEIARSGADIAAAVGFHSGLGTTRPEDASQIRGKVLVAIGADDPVIDAAQRAAFEDEMRAGNVDWQMHLYGGVVHSFTNPAADQMNRPDIARYSPTADARSWKTMIALFDEVFA